MQIILVWPTCWTPAVGGLIVCVCESVCPKTCRPSDPIKFLNVLCV